MTSMFLGAAPSLLFLYLPTGRLKPLPVLSADSLLPRRSPNLAAGSRMPGDR